MMKLKKYFAFVVMALAMVTSLQAQVPELPKTQRLVNDFAKVFNSAETRQLEQKLVQFDSQTSTQIAIVTMNDLGGLEPQEMATQIMKKWGVGGKDDNGVLILFKPKTAASRGQVFITTGYGVEAYVTDALAKKIVEYDMIPQFKAQNTYAGFDVATSSLMGLLKGEFSGTQYLENRSKRAKSGKGFPWLLLVIFVLPAILGGRNRRNTSTMGGRRSSLPFWLLLGAMGSGRSHGGSFGNFNSGGGGFGGFGGGFGGGGGAGGSW